VLSRAWQMLFRGIAEVQSAGKPIAAAEMVLVRIAYAADLPAPDEVIRSLGASETSSARRPGNGGLAGATTATAPRPEAPCGSARPALASALPVAPGAPAPIAVGRFADLIALAAEKRDLPVKTALERDVRLVRFENGRLEIGLEPRASKTLVNDLARKVSEWTGRRWVVVVSPEDGAPTVKAQAEAQNADLVRGVRADPLVEALLTRFPGAEIVSVRRRDVDSVGRPAGSESDETSVEPLLDGRMQDLDGLAAANDLDDET